MRILYHHRIRSKDGQYVHLEEMVHALRALGHQVEIVGPRHVETEEFGSDAGIVSLLKRWMPGPGYELAELAYSLADYQRLAAAIRRFQPDVIYERYNLYFPSGVWAKRRYGLPLLLEVNAPLFEERSRFDGISLPRLARWSEHAAWRGADYVLPVTQVLARRIEAAGVPADRVRVIPNGINTREFADLPSSAEAKRRHQLEGRLVLGFVGFMREWHGLERVLEFMANSAERERLFALFVGDGPVRGALEARARKLGIENSLRITGVMPREQVPKTLAAFDVALQPAVVDYASPLKLFEYLAVGLPIIAPDLPNIREVLTNAHNALLFDEEDAGDFVRCLSQMCNDAALRSRLAASAAATIASQGLTWRHNAERVTELAADLLKA